MHELIKQLEENLAELKKAVELKEALEYKAKEHKTFLEGDYVTNGDIIGIVGWTENQAMNIKESDGFMGVMIINKNGGFMGPCKRDEFELLDIKLTDYYQNTHVISFRCDGRSIDKFLNTIHYHVNSFEGQSALLDALNKRKNRFLETDEHE